MFGPVPIRVTQLTSRRFAAVVANASRTCRLRLSYIVRMVTKVLEEDLHSSTNGNWST